jgi:hypothetical protein
LAVGKEQSLLDAPIKFLVCLAFPGINGDPASSHRRGGMILSRENVAAAPSDLGTQFDQGFDQHCGLHGHVQATGDTGSLKGFRFAESLTQRH